MIVKNQLTEEYPFPDIKVKLISEYLRINMEKTNCPHKDIYSTVNQNDSTYWMIDTYK